MQNSPFPADRKLGYDCHMISIQFEKRTLSNGLDVIVHTDNSVPMVAVNVWYHVGAKNEEPGKTGFAHLFEHVMFEGSKNHNKDYFEPLQKIGANINGSTTSDRTNYWETLPSNYMDLALWLESDRMGFLLEALDQERFDLQRDVVKNERRQSYENRPYGLASLQLQGLLFPAPHPYSWPVIGSQEDLDAASLDDVKDFFRRHYHPSNASLTIAGDVNSEEAFSSVEKYFSDIRPGEVAPKLHEIRSPLVGTTSVTLEDSVQLPRLYMVWPSPADFTNEQAALDVLSVILADGRSSRLEKNLVYEAQKAHDVSAFNHGQEIAGEFHLIATAAPGIELEDIEIDLLNHVRNISITPPSQNEMERARNRIESYHTRQLEKIGGFGGRADQLNFYSVLGGDPELINNDIERYRSITPDDVSKAALSLGNDMVRMAVMPRTSKTISVSSLDRTKIPKESGVISFSPPKPERVKLSNGDQILYLNKPQLPITSIGVLLGNGGISDPQNTPGLTRFTTTMLGEGTGTRSSSQIAEEIEFLGSSLSHRTSREYSIASVSGLSSHLGTGIEILADIITNSTFPDKELERVRNEKVADLSTFKDNADLIADIASMGILFGQNSPYGHSMSGSENSVSRVTKKDLQKHYRQDISENRKLFVAVGSEKLEAVVEKIETSFANGKKQPPKNIFDNESETHGEPGIYIIDRPGAPQSVIRAGHLTVPRDHKDFFALSFVNYVLGGDYTSRLNLNLRQDKGYSYGFYSRIEWLRKRSVWLARGSVQTEVTKEAVQEIIGEFSNLHSDRPIEEGEFDRAKEGILKGMPSNFETISQMMSSLVGMAAHDLQDDYFHQSLESITSLGRSETLDAAISHMDPKSLIIVVVGDKANIEKGLSEIKLPITTCDMYGNPL